MEKYYSSGILSELKKRSDIVEVIGDYTDLHGYGSRRRGNNPFTHDRNESLVVSQKQQVYECLDTGEGGDVLSFLMRAENLSLNEAVENLASRLSLSLKPPSCVPRREEERQTILSMNREAARYFVSCMNSDAGSEGRDYFQKERGLTPKTIEKFALGFAPDGWNGLVKHLEKKGYSDEQILNAGLAVERGGGLSDKFRGRAMCPVMDTDGQIVGFSGRTLKADSNRRDGPKYLNSPETAAFDKKRCLYGLNFAASSKRNGIILCEGNMDVISQHQSGFDNAVAPMGTAFSDTQASLLKSYTHQIHLLYDSDEPGQRGAMRALSILKKHGFQVDVVDVSPHKDPDEFLHSERPSLFQIRVEQAEDYRHFEARQWMSGYDLSSPEERKEAFQTLGEKLLEEPEKDWDACISAAEEMAEKAEEKQEKEKEQEPPTPYDFPTLHFHSGKSPANEGHDTETLEEMEEAL